MGRRDPLPAVSNKRRFNRINRGMFRFPSINQGRKSIEFVAFRRTRLCTHQVSDPRDCDVVVSVTSNGCDLSHTFRFTTTTRTAISAAPTRSQPSSASRHRVQRHTRAGQAHRESSEPLRISTRKAF
jgi:hypothetical protein